MKILVTGALGHIGSRLIRMLPDILPDVEIVMVDNLMTQRYSSLFNLPDNVKYTFVEGDVTSMELDPLLKGVDAVVHLAAITDAMGSFNNKEEYERVNFTATKKIAEACARTSVSLIHASSTSIYGTEKSEVDEYCSDNEINPQSPYAETKFKEEVLVKSMVQNNGLSAMTFRFGTIFGVSPGMRFHTAVNKFCWQAVMGIPLSVWTTALEQKRPYLDLSDAVKAIAHIIENKLYTGAVYNVVTDNMTVQDVVTAIKSHIPHTDIKLVDSPIMNTLSYEVLNTRLSKEGFMVNGDYKKCIAETINILQSSNR